MARRTSSAPTSASSVRRPRPSSSPGVGRSAKTSASTASPSPLSASSTPRCRRPMTTSTTRSIDSEAKTKLFSGGWALGEDIRLNGESFTVIGVLDPKMQETDDDVNHQIYRFGGQDQALLRGLGARRRHPPQRRVLHRYRRPRPQDAGDR